MAFGFEWLSRKGSSTSNLVVDKIYKLSIAKDKFITADIISTYVKILTDVIDRTHGISEKAYDTFWDSCLESEVREGLVSLVAIAMAKCEELYLVYSPSTNVLRRATPEEKNVIKSDYEKDKSSSTGWLISFNGYYKTEMYRVYSELEYCSINSFNTIMNISKAVQIKVSGLRKTVSSLDVDAVVDQARGIADALRCGDDVMIDAEDVITNSTPEIGPTEKAVDFINGKKSNILGMPLSYINGELASGIGSTGDSDTRAIERGLKQYYLSIIEPILEMIYANKTEFRQSDFREITSKLETLKAFDLVGNEIISLESKQEIAAKMFDLDVKKELKRINSEKNIEQPIKQISQGFSN